MLFDVYETTKTEKKYKKTFLMTEMKRNAFKRETQQSQETGQ